MPEVSDVWLLGVVLTGETTFWLCEPTHLKPLAEDWKAINCRWLYPVLENLSDFADVSGFESTDAVYEVDWVGTSRVLRPATLAWNVRGKRQKVGDTTYVFVPAEEIKQLDEAFKRFVKLEATMKPPPPRRVVSSASADEAPTTAETKAMLTLDDSSSTLVHQEEDGRDDNPLVVTASRLCAPTTAPTAGEVTRETVTRKEDEKSASHHVDVDGSMVSSSTPHPRTPHRRGGTNLLSFPSHKRQTPHRGTTIYQAPVHRKPTGEHCSSEAFGWSEMYLVHRGSVDYLCPKAAGNTFGFRLDRVMHDGFPVFLLFSSSHNNSETIDASARGVPVFEKAQLSGEAGEGAVRSSVLVVTRLSSKKHQPSYRTDTGRTAAGSHRRRRRDDDDSTTTEEDEDADDYFDEEDDDDNTESDDTYEEEERRVGPQGSRRRAGDEVATAVRPTAATAAAAAAKRPKPEATDPAGESAATSSASRKKGNRKRDAAANKPLQAVSVNFWTDPQHVAPAPDQLAREFPFKSEGSDTPQTVVFSNGICVTYTASTAAKHAAPEKKRKSAKHGGASASSEDIDLSMLNEHILNAFAQVKKDCV